MIYGMYLSAAGVMTSSYRQDVLANNLANSETIGFKRDLTMFRERLTQAREQGLSPSSSDSVMENLTGGMWAMPTSVDQTQGDFEATHNKMDVAIDGKGFLMVQGKQGPRLTRDGRMMIDHEGNLIMANSHGEKVLGPDRKPIVLDSSKTIEIGAQGEITANTKKVAQIGIFDVPNPEQLKKEGGALFDYSDMSKASPTDRATLRSEFVERSNVDSATELGQLMDAQRQLEANANMIKYQDQALGHLVNEVGKIT